MQSITINGPIEDSKVLDLLRGLKKLKTITLPQVRHEQAGIQGFFATAKQFRTLNLANGICGRTLNNCNLATRGLTAFECIRHFFGDTKFKKVFDDLAACKELKKVTLMNPPPESAKHIESLKKKRRDLGLSVVFKK